MVSKAPLGPTLDVPSLTDDADLAHSYSARQRQTSGVLSQSLLRISKWRLVEYGYNQPATTLFLFSLVLLTVCTPMLSLYIQHYGQKLPDLDTMKVWNTFLGKLPSKQFCNISKVQVVNSSCTAQLCQTVGVVVEFLVGRELAELEMPVIGKFNGKDFKTKIRDSYTHKRIDGNITYNIFIDAQGNNCTEENYCHLNGCVLITAPINATHFNQLYDSSSFQLRPPPERLCTPSDIVHNQTDSELQWLSLIGSDSCKGLPTTIKLAQEKYSRHGLVIIYLSDDDLETAGNRLYAATTILLGLTLAFIIGISCTEKHKASLEARSD